MSIPSSKYLKVKAANRLESGKDPKKVVLVYSAIVALSALAVNVVQFILDSQISKTGGLQNIGTRSALSTLSSVLPLVQTLVLMCLGLGYTAAVLRLARRQYASEKTLKAGFERFWLLLRARLLQALIYGGIAFLLSYVAMAIFMLSPFSSRLSSLALSLSAAGAITPEALLNNTALLASAYEALMPMMVIYCILLVIVVWAVSYRFRLVDYLLIDQPQLGAFGALSTSRQKMKGNMMSLFKLDLSFWWYYLLRGLCMALAYVSLLPSLLGLQLSLSPTALYFISVLIYLGTDFALNYFLMNRVEVTYALFYDMLNPQPPQQEGAVLGNIFQM